MHVCTLQEENVVFLTQKVAAHDMCGGNFVISSIVQCVIVYCNIYITLKWQLRVFAFCFPPPPPPPHFDH
jgi:hypothetical protein